MAVLNVSRVGLLLESDVRLRPGTGICLNVVVDGATHRIDGRVQHVDARIVANKVVYRAGVAFDDDVAVFDPPSGSGRDDPVPAPPIEIRASNWGTRTKEAEAGRLREERDATRRVRDEQARTIGALREALHSGEALRQEILAAQAAERTRLEREQQELADRLREAEEQAASMVQDMRAARDAARRAAREHAAALAELETRVRERDQQLAALRAEQAALLESVTSQLEAYEQRDVVRQEHHGRLSGQLAASEAWCAAQQNLLYRVRQQMTAMFTVLDGEDLAFAVPPGHVLPEPHPLLAHPHARAPLAAVPVVRALPGPSGRTGPAPDIDREKTGT